MGIAAVAFDIILRKGGDHIKDNLFVLGVNNPTQAIEKAKSKVSSLMPDGVYFEIYEMVEWPGLINTIDVDDLAVLFGLNVEDF